MLTTKFFRAISSNRLIKSRFHAAILRRANLSKNFFLQRVTLQTYLRFLQLCEGERLRRTIRQPPQFSVDSRQSHPRFPDTWSAATLPPLPLYIAQDLQPDFANSGSRAGQSSRNRNGLPSLTYVPFTGSDDGGADVTDGNTRRGQSEAERTARNSFRPCFQQYSRVFPFADAPELFVAGVLQFVRGQFA